VNVERVNPYDLNAIAEVNLARRQSRSRNPNPYSLDGERNLLYTAGKSTMLTQTNDALNRWAAQVVEESQETCDSEGLEPLDYVCDANACLQLMKKVGERGRLWWESICQRWIYELLDTVIGTIWFHSSEQEPGRCVIEALMYIKGDTDDDG